MHIEAELDDIHAQRLLNLQQQRQQPITTLVAELLAQQIDALPNLEPVQAKSVLEIM
ncbi:MAG: hypothetical protein HQL48_08360 [Gammaproteobacteria bacterium]|nr:hypothetical protein [Gammaproteobacteria bacterium]